jgi:hypothetical protein
MRRSEIAEATARPGIHFAACGSNVLLTDEWGAVDFWPEKRKKEKMPGMNGTRLSGLSISLDRKRCQT